MSDIAIKVEGLGKKYLIGSQKSDDIRNAFGNRIKSLFGRKELSSQQDFWALQDINFEIKKGEAVGIIGRNGAGKSTLLRILSRITEPTKGRFEINGRVSSLLEVGTGFHPELTGRENVFLNGTILGMRRVEIKNKIDEIITFSGIDKFLDTPVKHYSSGMKVRLAFSVAAHLEPEILIIDEVLAVGDAEFQKKCLGKMDDVAGEGRTVIFVSHNLPAVNSLCQRGILLINGKSQFDGNANDIIDIYRNNMTSYVKRENNLKELPRIKGLGKVVFSKLIFNEYPILQGQEINFDLELTSKVKDIVAKNIDLGISIHNMESQSLIHCTNGFLNKVLPFDGEISNYQIRIDNNLRPGKYSITLFLRIDGQIHDWLNEIVHFEIEDGNPYAYSDTSIINGVIFPDFEFLLKE